MSQQRGCRSPRRRRRWTHFLAAQLRLYSAAEHGVLPEPAVLQVSMLETLGVNSIPASSFLLCCLSQRRRCRCPRWRRWWRRSGSRSRPSRWTSSASWSRPSGACSGWAPCCGRRGLGRCQASGGHEAGARVQDLGPAGCSLLAHAAGGPQPVCSGACLKEQALCAQKPACPEVALSLSGVQAVCCAERGQRGGAATARTSRAPGSLRLENSHGPG